MSSRNHHWWPVKLQEKYWADQTGNVSWVEPDGKMQKKKAKNRKISFKIHGHTLGKGGPWETNFETEFSIDNDIHEILVYLSSLKPFGYRFAELMALVRNRLSGRVSLRNTCKFYQMNSRLHRKALLFILSLVIRSPSIRSKYERYPEMIGLPPNEDVGKVNMVEDYRIAKRLCQEASISNQYFTLLHSPPGNFIFGDGCLDWITSGFSANRIRGRLLIALTPHLCIYFSTPISMRSQSNCASLIAPPWMVERVNEITQIYSGEKLFFRGKRPKLTEAFRRRLFLEHSSRTDWLIDELDEIVGTDERPFRHK